MKFVLKIHEAKGLGIALEAVGLSATPAAQVMLT